MLDSCKTAASSRVSFASSVSGILRLVGILPIRQSLARIGTPQRSRNGRLPVCPFCHACHVVQATDRQHEPAWGPVTWQRYMQVGEGSGDIGTLGATYDECAKRLIEGALCQWPIQSGRFGLTTSISSCSVPLKDYCSTLTVLVIHTEHHYPTGHFNRHHPTRRQTTPRE